MTDAQLPLPIARPHHNHQLFSDHYLNVILPQRPAWSLLVEEAQAAMAAVGSIFRAYTPSTNEAQTEHDLIHPILRALGFDFEVQPTLKTPDGVGRPDYVFYRDAVALNANKNRTLDDTLPQRGGFAVGDAKQWDRPLDVTLRGRAADPFTNKNPSFQIAFYIQHSGVDWGLLTNGRLWRLYHRETAHKLDRYYEVDLPALLESGGPAAFLYFHAFFRRAAFDEGPLSVAEILRESVDYARAIGDSLQQQVFDALLHLAQGFLDYPANGLSPDEATLKEIYDNSLIVLYRLLFVLYAEDRDLLPVNERGMYRSTYSLYAVKRAVTSDLRVGRQLLPTSARVWPQLRDLFQIIDSGNAPLHVATFNGGLFDPQRHPFLERYTVGDLRMQRAIDCLAQVNGQFVDYRDLSVRHLGTIYEGLLEYHLATSPDLTPGPSPKDLRLKAQGGEGRSSPTLPAAPLLDAPASLGEGRMGPMSPIGPIPPGSLQSPILTLLNDRGERKASGSYYTPDYIVKYMVEGTLGPILEAATAGLTDDAAKIEAVLGVKVLDPAMGSGHFPVEATEYIARFLVDLGVVPDGDAVGEADLAYWKRRVAQNCIYGVDLNPLAVELAKLSLWLTTVATDRPLSFLDHHLRTGNALVGARLDDLQIGTKAAKQKSVIKAAKQEAAGQISMLADDAFRQSMSHAVSNMWLIEGSEARTVGQVKQQEALYNDLRASFTGKYGRLADLVTATLFGVTVDPKLRQPLFDFATGRALTTLPELEAKLAEAERLAESYRFFHWELEFPEVFFDRFGRPLEGQAGLAKSGLSKSGPGLSKSGFDAVIGNPPYVRQEQLTPFKPYLQSRYAAFHGVADLYLYFFEQGLKLARTDGRMAYISSGTFARANFATEFRKMLPTLAQMESIIDFGENQPFEGAEMVRPSIVLLKRGTHTEPFRSLLITEKVPQSLERALEEEGIECDAAALDQPEWTFQAAGSTRLFTKLLKAGRKLVDVVDGKMYRGVLTGLNEAFIIDGATRARLIAADPGSAEIIKPVLRGEDLRPWYQEDEDRWLIFTRRGIEIDAYPAVKEYLAGFRTQLEPRPSDWDDSKLWGGRKPGPYQWYEIQDSVDYYHAFNGPKVYWPDIAKLPRFSWADPGLYCGNTGYMIPAAPPALLGILQSRVIWFAIAQVCQPLRLRAGLWQYRMFPQFLSRLPIPDLSDADRETIGGLAMAITERARARYTLHCKARHRLLADLGTPGKTLNNRLTAWWDQDFSVLRAEVKKVFGRDIPLRERDEWEAWFHARKAEHEHATAEIVRLETDLNARVYALFGLTPEEIQTIEEQTKYRYGEV